MLELIATGTFGAGSTFPLDLPPEDVMVEIFRRHEETVRAALPAERLLVFDVREGWEPLCRFLEVPVPEEPFPHLNEGETMRRTLEEVAVRGVIPNPFEQR
ncbi:MAG: hypothetical protein GEV11_06915 [Streptosporangiales bacterium]|nr:hypothetical protein [Streptosporangiales bacterium]